MYNKVPKGFYLSGIFRRQLGISWNFLEFLGISRTKTEFQEFIGISGIPRNSQKFLDISRTKTECQEFLKKTEFQEYLEFC
jgi:hypothetical protein